MVVKLVNPMEARTFLFVPGHRPDLTDKADRSGADAVICDLEDGVPSRMRPDARARLAAVVRASPGMFMVRINSVQSAEGERDLAFVGQYHRLLAGVLVAKCESLKDVEAARSAAPDAPLVLQVESARGLGMLTTMLGKDLGPTRLAMGNLDLGVDLGCDQDSATMAFASAKLVVASRLASMPGPIDGVTPQTSDLALARSQARRARARGYAGKLCIHPAQVAPTLEGLAPTAETVAWAKSVASSIGDDGGAVAVAGEMVDAPVLARAMRILRESGVEPA